MADKTLQQLPEAGTLTGQELVHIAGGTPQAAVRTTTGTIAGLASAPQESAPPGADTGYYAKPFVRQVAARRDSGWLGLIQPLKAGNKLILVQGGNLSQANNYVPSGFNLMMTWSSNAQNTVRYYERTIQPGDTCNHYLTASDRQFCAIYEIENAALIRGLALRNHDALRGGPNRGTNISLQLPRLRSPNDFQIVVMTQDSQTMFNIPTQEGVQLDYNTVHEGNHTGFIARCSGQKTTPLTGSHTGMILPIGMIIEVCGQYTNIPQLFPYTLPVTNPSGANGTTGWVSTVGGSFSADSSYLFSSEPTKFVLAANSQQSHVHQGFNLPADTISEADAGRLSVNFGYDYSTWDDADYARMRIIYYSQPDLAGDVLGVEIGVKRESNSHQVVVETGYMPSGTRSFSVGFIGERFSGGELSFYFNRVNVKLVRSGRVTLPIFARNDTDSLNWTVTAGSKTGDYWHSGSNLALPGYYGGQQPTLAYHKDFALNADALALIQSGQANVRYGFAVWSLDGDKGRTYVQCLNDANEVLATIEDASIPTDWGPTTQIKNLNGVIPAGTTKLRLGFTFERTAPQYSQTYYSQLNVTINKPN